MMIRVYVPVDCPMRELGKLVGTIKNAGLVLHDLNVGKGDDPVIELVFVNRENANGNGQKETDTSGAKRGN